MAREFDVARDGEDDDAVDIIVGNFEDDNLIHCDAIGLANLENAVKKGQRILKYGTKDGSVPEHELNAKQTAHLLIQQFPNEWEAMVKSLEGSRQFYELFKMNKASFPNTHEKNGIDRFIDAASNFLSNDDDRLVSQTVQVHHDDLMNSFFNVLKNRYKQDGVSVDD